MKEEAHNDHGTVLKPDQAALVFDTDGRMSIVLPEMPPDTEIPSGWRLMLAIIQKSSDPIGSLKWSAIIAAVTRTKTIGNGRGHRLPQRRGVYRTNAERMIQ